MRIPRHQQVTGNTRQTFHAISRCVRRSFLCGTDPLTGHNFDHRKLWIEKRLVELAKHFAVLVHAYAVMSNHLHVLFDIDPTAVQAWSDRDVAQRWLMLTVARYADAQAQNVWVAQCVNDPERIAELRRRLGDPSWFMALLKEPIARRANREDDCTGHFWEGRFQLKATLDDEALLSQMVYIDLNPLRAGLTKDPTEGPYTSAAKRAQTHPAHLALKPIAGHIEATLPEMTEGAYLELLRWSAKALYCPQHPPAARPRVAGLVLPEAAWLEQVAGTEKRFRRAVGSAHSLAQHAKKLGQNWLVGITFARRLSSAYPPQPAAP